MAQHYHLTNNAEWLKYLTSQGAIVDDKTVVNFGHPNEELGITNSQGDIITDLGQMGLLAVIGKEARLFLQGQVTCDLEQVSAERGALGCYVNLQGRTIASFRLFQYDPHLLDETLSDAKEPYYVLAMHKSLIPIVMERLQKFIAFSQAELKDLSDEWVKLGLSGPCSQRLIESAFAAKIHSNTTFQDNTSAQDNTTFQKNAAAQNNRTLQNKNGVAILVSSEPVQRYEVYCRPTLAVELWSTWCNTNTPVGTGKWELQNIRTGIAMISDKITEKVMPAELGYDRNGGISFTKGCYAGQEVVARLHYKGTPKQDLYRIEVESPNLCQPGTKISLVDNENVNVGVIISAARSTENTVECLAVLRIAKAELADVEIAKTGKTYLVVDSAPAKLLERVLPTTE